MFVELKHSNRSDALDIIKKTHTLIGRDDILTVMALIRMCVSGRAARGLRASENVYEHNNIGVKELWSQLAYSER